MERTDSDILAKAPIKVLLGSTEYDVHPLTILKAREWRAKVNESFQSIAQSFAAKPEPGNLGPALTGALLAFPEKLAELVFAYAPDLPQQTILEEATEEQMNAAFGKIMKLAFPFVGQLAQTIQILKASL